MKLRYFIKISLITILSMIMSVSLSTFVNAQESNTLIIQVETEEEAGNLPLSEKSEFRFLIWRIGEGSSATSQSEYDSLVKELNKRSLTELNQSYPQPLKKLSDPNDTQGKIIYKELANGRYYVRQDLTVQTTSRVQYVSFVVDLPRVSEVGLLFQVTVTPKKFTPEKPEVPDVGGRKFIKVDEADKPLAKAYFKVVNREVNDKGDYIKDEQGAYIYQDVLLAGKSLLLESGTDGRFQVEGLPYGTYWLVETVSPQGYSLLNEPLEFTVTKTSLEESSVIKIINKKKPEEKPGKVKIPSTGDMAIFLIILVGVALIILGGWLTRSSAKSRD